MNLHLLYWYFVYRRQSQRGENKLAAFRWVNHLRTYIILSSLWSCEWMNAHTHVPALARVYDTLLWAWAWLPSRYLRPTATLLLGIPCALKKSVPSGTPWSLCVRQYPIVLCSRLATKNCSHGNDCSLWLRRRVPLTQRKRALPHDCPA